MKNTENWQSAWRVLAIAVVLIGLTGTAHGATISIFPTGTTVDLTFTIDTTSSTITGTDVRGLAGFVVLDPPIANGVLIGDFGRLPAPSNQLLGIDALTLSQVLLFTLDINAYSHVPTGIQVPGSATIITPPITDPALSQFEGNLLFGFTPASSTVDGGIQTVVFNLASVSQVPEPATFTMLAPGLAAFLLLRKRRLSLR